jgi:hypothetical protein
MKAELKKAEDRIAELTKPKDPELFPRDKVGSYISALHYGSAKGVMTFTNTTPKSGILCLKGVATNTATNGVSESLATCREIKPYDSNVNLAFEFAGSDLRRICPTEDACQFSVRGIDGK